jgi:hypothetical protein
LNLPALDGLFFDAPDLGGTAGASSLLYSEDAPDLGEGLVGLALEAEEAGRPPDGLAPREFESPGFFPRSSASFTTIRNPMSSAPFISSRAFRPSSASLI